MSVTAVIAPIIGGITGFGLFTFAGGVVMLARFGGAGLPAVKCVAAVPRAELLVLGLVATYILVLAGFALVLLLTALWPRLRTRRDRAGVLIALAGLAAASFVRQVDPSALADPQRRLALVAVLLVLASGAVVAYQYGERALARPRGEGELPRMAAFVAITLSTMIVFTLLTIYARNLDDPRLQAIAVLRTGAPPLTGIYVGEDAGNTGPTPNKVYVGLLGPRQGDDFGDGGREPNTGSLVAVQSPAVTAVAIGPVEPLDDALRRGPRLLTRLQAER